MRERAQVMRTALGAVAFLFVLVYPFAVYFGLTRLSMRELLWVLGPLVVLVGLARLVQHRGERALSALAPVVVMGTLIGLTGLLADQRFLLATPVLINLVLLAGFAGSLRSERPLVERFARLQVEDLSPQEVVYCRRVTIVWSVFFVCNALVAGALALFAPLSWWTLYTGLISYLFVGAVGAVEYIYRKYRFGRFGTNPIDRVLRVFLTRGAVSG